MNLSFVFRPKDVRRIQVDAELGEPEHPGCKRLLSYWRSKIGLDGLVPRAAIQPRDLVPLLPWLFIAEPIESDWRFRLMGTGLCAGFGADLTGRTLRQIFREDTASSLIALYKTVVAGRQPKTLKGRYVEAGLDHVTAEGIHLPLMAPDRRTSFVFGGVFFSDQKIG